MIHRGRKAHLVSYDVESKKYAVDSYKGQTDFIGTIALRKDQPGVSFLP